MATNEQAAQDYERAIFKGFWRKILSRIRGQSNELLPFDDVRERLPVGGQHYLGLRQVRVDKIIGSMSRFRDFDRAFLPVQTTTKDRWISIDKAHYDDVILPPVDLYKMGEIYFVKDGNHRVSVARERGQIYLDAYVVEIDVPVVLNEETRMDDLKLKAEYADFMIATRLNKLRPDANLETRISGQYQRILEHIAVHRWYLGEQLHSEAAYEEAVCSWYDQVYMPIIDVLRQQSILKNFPAYSELDMYLWIVQYQAYLRQLYRGSAENELSISPGIEPAVKMEAGKQISVDYPDLPLKKLVNAIRRAEWVDDLILNQERAAFLKRTNIQELRPDAQILATLPGEYDKLLEHIAVHRWYLGEQQRKEVSFEDAVTSWYDNVYLPLVKIIREQNVLAEFPGREEADLYLWIISRREYLRQAGD